MSYTVGELKIAAYNRQEPQNMTVQERNLYIGLSYCYDWFKSNPDDKADCEELMRNYIQFFENHQLRELSRRRESVSNI